jgi:hypothetical protein
MYVICDSCGAKVHQSETILVNDKYSLQNGLVICTVHLNDREYGLRPINTNETIVSNPRYVRSENSDRFITNANDDTAPTAPRNVRPQASTIGNYVDIYWEGPESIGSSAIESYTIYRRNPQLGGTAVTIVTGESITYYRDENADVDTEYSYTIAATNGYGTGPESSPGYYPTIRVAPSVVYLLDESGNYITDENGTYIVE